MKHILRNRYVIAALITCTGTLAAQTVEERVDSLEKKMDRVLELLEAQQKQPQNQAPAAAAAEAKDQNKAGVPVEKDKTVLVAGTSLKAFIVTRESFETPQISDPVVMFVDRGADFSMNNFLATPASKTFERHPVGLKWEGYLWIDKPGKYLFSATCFKRVYGSSVLTLSLNGNKLLKTDGDQRAPALGTIEIENPGAYFFEVWMSHSKGMATQYSFGLEYSIMGAAKMDKISPATLYTKKEK